MPTKEPISARNLLADPAFAVAQAKRMAEHETRSRHEFKIASEAISSDLRSRGMAESLIDLLEQPFDKETATILIHHLGTSGSMSVDGAILQWIKSPDARDSQTTICLLQVFQKFPSEIVPIKKYVSGTKFRIGEALEYTATRTNLATMEDLVRDNAHRWDNDGIIVSLINLEPIIHPEAKETLLRLASDRKLAQRIARIRKDIAEFD